MLTELFRLDVEVGTPQTSGPTAAGERRCIPILGGRLYGRLNGRVLGGGADWQVLRPDGVADLDARYMLETDAGAHIEVHSRGLRVSSPAVMARMAAGERVEASAYYMRTAMRFETAAPDLQWLVGRLAVGFGERLPDLVRLTVCEIA
jgi:hypothetical protein